MFLFLFYLLIKSQLMSHCSKIFMYIFSIEWKLYLSNLLIIYTWERKKIYIFNVNYMLLVLISVYRLDLSNLEFWFRTEIESLSEFFKVNVRYFHCSYKNINFNLNHYSDYPILNFLQNTSYKNKILKTI